MNTADRIREQVPHLPEPAQQTVLDFVEQLAQRLKQDDHDWAAWSLQAALRGAQDDI